MSTRIVVAIAAILIIGLFVRVPGTSTAASPEVASRQQAEHAHEAQKPMGMPEMQKMHEKMMADLKAEQQKLDEMVKKMNSAKGDARVDAIAAIVTQMVEHHRGMAQHMDMMHQHMMKTGK